MKVKKDYFYRVDVTFLSHDLSVKTVGAGSFFGRDESKSFKEA